LIQAFHCHQNSCKWNEAFEPELDRKREFFNLLTIPKQSSNLVVFTETRGEKMTRTTADQNKSALYNIVFGFVFSSIFLSQKQNEKSRDSLTFSPSKISNMI